MLSFPSVGYRYLLVQEYVSVHQPKAQRSHGIFQFVQGYRSPMAQIARKKDE